MDFANYITIQHAPEVAKAILSPACENLGRLPDIEEVKSLFREQGVSYGFDDHVISEALAKRRFNQEIIVAKATMPAPGQDARIQILISPDGGAKPQIQADGKADYKEIGTLVQVKAETVLARLLPATAGTAGKDIYGNTLEAAKGRDAKLPAGVNTRVSDDGLTLVAVKSGCLFIQGGRFSVSEAYVVGGGVNFKTGNIRFEGDVDVQGGVAEGFTVEAAGNLRVTGEVEGAVLISRGGNIVLEAGVFGKGKARIEAHKGEVRLSFAQAATIQCRKLVVEKFLQSCDVKCWELDASASGCLVSGTTLVCFGAARIADLGAEGTRTQITILDEQEEEFLADKSRLDVQVSKVKEQIEIHDKKLRSFKALLAKSGQARIPPKTVEEIKSSGELVKALGRTLYNIQSELTMILAELAKPRPRNFVLSVRGVVHGAASLDMFHIKRVLGSADSRKEFAVKPGEGLISYDCPAA